MAVPVIPIAVTAARIAIIGAGVIMASRTLAAAPRDQRAEDALDDVGEGLGVARTPDGVRGTARWTRTIRVGSGGPGVTVDVAALGRLRVRRAP